MILDGAHAGGGSARSTDPWALSPEERRLCLRIHRDLRHSVRIFCNGKTRSILVRDTSVAKSDAHLACPEPIIWGTAERRGILTHLVKVPSGWKKVYERVETGELSMGGCGKPTRGAMVWDPPPPVLTVMRSKTPPMAVLLRRPVVPVDLGKVVARRPLPDWVEAPGKPGRPTEPFSRSSLTRLWTAIEFIGEGP
jgi:hypothetical protein